MNEYMTCSKNMFKLMNTSKTEENVVIASQNTQSPELLDLTKVLTYSILRWLVCITYILPLITPPIL